LLIFSAGLGSYLIALFRASATEENYKKVFQFFTLSSVIFCSLALTAAFNRNWANGIGGLVLAAPDVHFIFPNQNLLAGSLAVPALFFVAGFLGDSKSRFLRFLCLPPLATTIVLSGSRGAVLALVSASIWITAKALIGRQPFKKILWPLGMALILAGFFFFPGLTYSKRLSAQTSPETQDPNAGFRPQIWKAGLDLGWKRPWSGFGLGSFSKAVLLENLPSPFMQRFPLARYRLHAEHAHGEWVETMAEGGLPLLSACLALAALFLVILWRRPWKPGGFAVEAALMAIGMQALVDFNLRAPGIAVLAGLLISIVLPKARLRRSPVAFLALASSASFLFCACLQRQVLASGEEPAKLLWLERSSATLRSAAADAAIGHIAQGGNPESWGQALRWHVEATEIAAEDPDIPSHYALALWNAWEHLDPLRLHQIGETLPDWEKTAELGRSERERIFLLAESEMEKAISLKPFDAKMRMALARLWLRAGKNREAEQAADAALALEPSFAAAWEMKARLEKSSGQIELLQQSLKRLAAIKLMPIEEGDAYSAGLKSADWPWIEAQRR
jgi:O-antigen ligase